MSESTQLTERTEANGRGRRRFTTEQKYRIVAAANACSGVGEVAALLRREGIYPSYLHNWRNQAKRAGLLELAGGRCRADAPTPRHNAELRRLCRRRKHLEEEVRIGKRLLTLQCIARELLASSASSSNSGVGGRSRGTGERLDA